MKIIFMPWYKGWFKGLGLHHALVASGLIAICHYIGIGDIGAGIAIGWYAQREWGLQSGFPEAFEFWDFVSPATISILYLIFGGTING